MSTELGGAFITEFVSWRKTKITTHAPTAVTTTIDSLLVDTYMGISKHDVVKKESDDLLSNVLNFYQTDLGLKAIGVVRPELNSEVAEFVKDDKSVTFYKDYSKLALLQELYNSKKDTSVPTKVKIDQVTEDIKTLTSNTFLAKHTMMMTYIATKNKAPEMLPYIYNATTFIPKLKTAILDNAYINKWITDTVAYQKANADDPKLDGAKFNEFKFRLDLLDPTFALSNEIYDKYYNALLAAYGMTGIKNTPLIRKIFKETLKEQIKLIETSAISEFSETLTNVKAMFGGHMTAFYNKMTQAFLAVGLNLKEETANMGLNPGHVVTIDSAALVTKLAKKIKPGATGRMDGWKKLKADANFHKFANGLLLCCQAAALAYGIANWNNLSKFDKSLLIVGGVFTIFDAVNSIANNKILIKIGDTLSTLIKGSVSSRIAEKLATMVKYVGKTFKYINKFVAPVLVVVSIFFSAWDIFQNAKVQKWGQLALSIVEFTGGIALFIMTVFISSSWTGPVSLILTGLLILVAIAKVLWDLIENLINGDPIDNFVKSVESKYQLGDEEYYKLFWTNLYKYGSDAQKQLQIGLMKVAGTSDPTNVIYRMYLVVSATQ